MGWQMDGPKFTVLSNSAQIGTGTQVWHFAQIGDHVKIGTNCVIGSFVYIDRNVLVGNNCKIQNRALIYDPAIIHDGVFIGPGAILTNDKNPRAISISGKIVNSGDWDKVGVEIFEGASIGAGAICVAPLKIGKWAVVGAGSVVTKDVKNYSLVVGNPARQVGWVGPAGVALRQLSDTLFECPKTFVKFELMDFELHEMIQG
jgi:UDP-2-acetamido-3-amino-2,3-dideoxy-glucuronate N-acetyltransferase